MTATNGFPLELLKKTTAERLAYFKAYTVAHPKLKGVYEALMRAIKESAGASFIFVYGPSGVGKTTVRLKVEQNLMQEALSDRRRMPLVGIEAVAPDSRNFSWKNYYMSALVALEEPLLDDKFDYGVRGIYRDSLGKMVIESKVDSPASRRALEKALVHRQPDVFFIEEAQHMAKRASTQKRQDQVDTLRSLANRTGILHGLFGIGTDELLNLSKQLTPYSVDIPFPPYSGDIPEDVQAFKNVLWTFQHQMPLPESPDLLAHWEYCYEGTLGCVGTLKDWLTRALRDALEERATTVTKKHLERTAPLVI